MTLDICWPIGIMFSLVGAMMAVFGLMTKASEEMYKRSLDININLWWGLVLLVFGGLMLFSAWKNSKKTPSK
jgi:predicted CDP-diglyceride synthetase/phosphatidate cytidylyltransferase